MRIRKPRPTLKDAHEFRMRGTYSVCGSDYITDKERIDEAERVKKQLLHLTTKAVPRTRNLEYLVLKCHTITEFALTEYIRCLAHPVVTTNEIRFTYAQKLQIAYLLGLGVGDPVLLPSLELLNRARNQVAHTLKLDTQIIHELLQINADETIPKSVPLTKQLRGIRSITLCICAQLCGQLSGQIHCFAKNQSPFR